MLRLLYLVPVLFLGPLEAAKKPNILLMMADDLGFSDLGCYGSEIQTPQLDSLAEGGLRFTQFYNTGRCWPTRTALLTGYYPQQVGRDSIPGLYKGGGRGIRPDWAPLLPTFLKDAGYRSYHVGKWHIDGNPVEGGFDRSYYMRDQHRFFSPEARLLDDKPLPKIEPGTDFYATTSLGDHAIAFLDEHSKAHATSPFFCYLAFAAPHFPLHALPKDIAKYEGVYEEGWDVVRKKRWARVQEIGLAKGPLSPVDPEVGPPYHFPKDLEILGPDEVNRPVPWDQLTPRQKKFQATKMAIHAAMIDSMDQQIGRVLNQIRKMGVFDDTLVLFLSDNGASAEIMVRADGHDPAAPMGSASSHLCLGPGWSGVCNTPFRMHKTWTHEGGTCTPLIAHWPEGIVAHGELRESPGHVIDLFPTLLDLAGIERAAAVAGKEIPDRPGMTMTSIFRDPVEKGQPVLWWCHDGHRALREGDWKIVAQQGDDWELFHLGEDRTETKDLAKQFPERIASMEAIWTTRAEEFAASAPPAKEKSRSARDREKAQQEAKKK